MLVTNVYQAIILCLYNKHESLKYIEMKEKSGIADSELKTALTFLCNPKNKLLAKENQKVP